MQHRHARSAAGIGVGFGNVGELDEGHGVGLGCLNKPPASGFELVAGKTVGLGEFHGDAQ
jgi:hypothetical protein